MAIFRFEIESEDAGEMRSLMTALFGITAGAAAAVAMDVEPPATPAKKTRTKAAPATAKEIEVDDAVDQEEETPPVKPAKVSKPTEQLPAAGDDDGDDLTLEQVKAKGGELMPHVGGATGLIALIKSVTKAAGGVEIGGYGSLPQEMYRPVYDAFQAKLDEANLG